MSEDNLNVKVLRYHPKNGQWLQSYTVPRSRGMTILGVLTYIHDNLDETFTFDYSCRAGRCGTCGVMKDGKPVLACENRVDDKTKEMLIISKANHEVVKDLMAKDAELWETRKKILAEAPFTPKGSAPQTIPPHQAERFNLLDTCIECALCQAACPNLRQKSWVGPIHGVFIAKLDSHPADTLDRSEMMKRYGSTGCNTNTACQATCPKGVPITWDALIPEKEKWVSNHDPLIRLVRGIRRKLTTQD